LLSTFEFEHNTDVHMIPSAREFLRTVVIENYNECHNRASDIRLAMNFAISCVSLCDWVAADYAGILPGCVDKDPRHYENRLRARSPEFALVCDMANAWKHTHISRKDRRLTSAQHVRVDHLRAGDPCGLSLLPLAAEADGGRRVLVEPAFGRVLQLWRQELYDLGELAKHK
jgi:hypothetical protein